MSYFPKNVFDLQFKREEENVLDDRGKDCSNY